MSIGQNARVGIHRTLPDPSLAEGWKAEATGKPTSTRGMTNTGSGSKRNASVATASSGKAQVDALV
jgi:hypothetical protein